MNDLQFREIVARVVHASQEITWQFVDFCGPSLSIETDQVLAIVGFTLVSNLISRSEMTECQRGQLWDCVTQGQTDPDKLLSVPKEEIN